MSDSLESGRYVIRLTKKWCGKPKYCFSIQEKTFKISFNESVDSCGNCERCVRVPTSTVHLSKTIFASNGTRLRFVVENPCANESETVVTVLPTQLKVSSTSDLGPKSKKKGRFFVLKLSLAAIKFINDFLMYSTIYDTIDECHGAFLKFAIEELQGMVEERQKFMERTITNFEEASRRNNLLERLSSAKEILGEDSDRLDAELAQTILVVQKRTAKYVEKIQNCLQEDFGYLSEELPFLDERRPDNTLVKKFMETIRCHPGTPSTSEALPPFKNLISWHAKLGLDSVPNIWLFRYSNHGANLIENYFTKKGFEVQTTKSDSGSVQSMTISFT